eukprot:scaffold126685_cov26-Tisochrysis_lutea.AAC.1
MAASLPIYLLGAPLPLERVAPFSTGGRGETLSPLWTPSPRSFSSPLLRPAPLAHLLPPSLFVTPSRPLHLHGPSFSPAAAAPFYASSPSASLSIASALPRSTRKEWAKEVREDRAVEAEAIWWADQGGGAPAALKAYARQLSEQGSMQPPPPASASEVTCAAASSCLPLHFIARSARLFVVSFHPLPRPLVAISLPTPARGSLLPRHIPLFPGVPPPRLLLSNALLIFPPPLKPDRSSSACAIVTLLHSALT